MNLTESWNHAVELEWQERQEAQSLPGWAVDGVLSSMPRCPPGSLRSVQLPLDHLVEMRDRAVCHQHRNGRRSHVPVWWEPVMWRTDLGLNRSLCSWILDFLTGRSQVVRMGNNTSSPLILNTGAPQGCVLSPLLYSLYTHDCTATHSSNVIVKFADDTTVIGLITDNEETAYREEVRTLTKWCQENHLSLNIDKTKELVVDYRRQSREHTPITIDKTPEWVSSFKFLGVHITEDLTWSAHTDAVLKKAHQRLFFLRRLRKFGMSPRILRSFYTCTVESILTGCITAWFGNNTAGNRKASCELPATLLEVSFPPSRTSTPGGVQGKPVGLSKTPATRPTDCSLCCPQGDVSAASDPALADWGTAFSPQAIRLMNSQK